MKRAILLAVILIALLISCVSIEDSVRTAPGTNVVYTASDGTEIRAYLAGPSGSGPHPAVLMIHEWWGLNEDVTILADALAKEGFVVLAADAYRGNLATSVAEALSLTRRTPVAQIRGDLDAALDFLISCENVDSNRVGSTGFCFGGRESMHLGIRSDQLAAVVTLYGSDLVTDPTDLGNLGQYGPVLGIFGENDNSIPLKDVEAFDAALNEVDAVKTITVYPRMGHAFVKSTTYQDESAPGQAWDQMVQFFKDNL
jgi:carboxymethylenebutenolidase